MEADRDGRDPESTHIVAVAGGRVVGTCRLLFRAEVARLGRLAVEPGDRGQGVAGAILREADRVAAGEGAERIALHAQTYALAPLPRARLRGVRPALRGGGHRARGDGEAAVT